MICSFHISIPTTTLIFIFNPHFSQTPMPSSISPQSDLMVEGGGAFPVVFFDGDREIDIGDVQLYPDLEYKPFQLMLSKMIGISPNQISIYLADRKNSSKSLFSEERRRIPITGKANFASLCLQKDCFFLVILKRSRKSRNRRARMITGDISPPPAPENLILLRRNQPFPFFDHITESDLDDLNVRLRSLSSPCSDSKSFCKECWKGTTSFHPCVNDAVVTRFTARLGPINRPNRSFS